MHPVTAIVSVIAFILVATIVYGAIETLRGDDVEL